MSNSEYEVQLYGTTSAQLATERRILLQLLLNNALEKIGNPIKSEKTISLLKEQKTKVIQKILESMEDDFKEHEIVDQKYLTIPGYVLLDKDIIYSEQIIVGTEDELDKEIKELKQLYLENSIMFLSLKAEEERYTSVMPYIEEQLETHAQLKQCFNAINNFQHLSTLMNETKSFIDKLRKD